jgi:hypothetical protein
VRAAIGLVWAALSGCGYVCAHEHACPDLEGDDEVSLAIERAARWLSRQPARGDESWYLRQGALAQGGRVLAALRIAIASATSRPPFLRGCEPACAHRHAAYPACGRTCSCCR